MRRGIEVVDFACGAPTLLQGRTLRDVSAGVDQDLYRYPLGVCAGIPPFNFPVMIPLWMFPLAVVAGNTFVLKPSERTPLGGAAPGRALPRSRLSRGRAQRRARREGGGRRAARTSRRARDLLRRLRAGRACTSIAPRPRTASACRRWAARRTTSSSCLTPTSTSRCRRSSTRPSATPASAAWRDRWRSSSAGAAGPLLEPLTDRGGEAWWSDPATSLACRSDR